MVFKKDRVEDEPIHAEYMKTLKCDCCGEEILSLRFPFCVMNPYEVICMDCYRSDYRENARNIKQNANNYNLQSQIDQLYADRACNHTLTSEKIANLQDKIDSLQNDIQSLENHNKDVNAIISSAYRCAISTDSAAAIEILRDVKEQLKEKDR